MAGPPLSAPLSAPLSPSASERPPILVAVDDDATSALEYAAQAARRAGCGLHLLHVVEPGSPTTAHDAGEALLRRAASHAAALTTGSAPVTTELAHAGPVADVLVHRAAAARQLVLQCRPEGAGVGTCSRVVCRASCPVVMVPSRPRAAAGGTPDDDAHQGLSLSPALPETLP